MITNFEEITYDLTDKEQQLVPIIIRGLQGYKKDNPIKSDVIVERINAKYGKCISGPRLRKICNYIRSTGQLPIIATSKGYYVSYDREEIQRQIKSLNERADAIRGCADGLKRFIN